MRFEGEGGSNAYCRCCPNPLYHHRLSNHHLLSNRRLLSNRHFYPTVKSDMPGLGRREQARAGREQGANRMREQARAGLYYGASRALAGASRACWLREQGQAVAGRREQERAGRGRDLSKRGQR
jgi:hypothetical protein